MVLHYNRVKFVGTVTVILWAVMLGTVGITILVTAAHFQVARAIAFPAGWFSFSWGFLLGLGGASMIALYDLMGY